MKSPDRAAEPDRPRLVEPWSAFATNWARVASPLRPLPEDLRRLQQAWVSSLPAGLPERQVDVLMLGVTPEFALFRWAAQFQLRALDCSPEMIRGVWPGDTPERQALLGDWRRMPFADASFDLIICDTGLALLVEMADLLATGREIYRLLRPGGRAVLRHFAPPARDETPAVLVAATEAGTVANFHGLKLRLLMALSAQNCDRAVRLGDAWDCFQVLFPDRAELAHRLGCELETVDTIDTYRGRDGRYIFRSLAEVAAAFDGFRMDAGPAGHYPFAEYCPVFSLTPIE